MKSTDRTADPTPMLSFLPSLFALKTKGPLMPQRELQAANMRLAVEHALKHPRALP